ESPQQVAEILRGEEESFARTLDRGIALFDEAAERAVKQHNGEIQGDDAFKLHDTYGFPIDLTQIMAQERRLSINIGEYERLMEKARVRARSAGADQSTLTAEAVEAVARSVAAPAETDDSPKYTSTEVAAVIRTYVEVDGPAKSGVASHGEPK